MTFRQAYEPFRNLLAQMPAVESLAEIWRMAAPFERDPRLLRRTMLREEVDPPCFPWDLDVLSREVLLNGSSQGGRGLSNRSDLADAVRLIRELEEWHLRATETHWMSSRKCTASRIASSPGN